MNIFEYITQGDPYSAKAICSKYGYEVQNVQGSADLAVCLNQLVAHEGEAAMKDILSLHPDKDIILETFSEPGAQCSCEKSKGLSAYVPELPSQVKDSHLFIFAGALLLAAAIIAKN